LIGTKSYAQHTAEIGEELKTRTLGEIDARRGISRYDYTGVGFGYNLKECRPRTYEEALNDIATPEFDELVKMANEL